VTYIVSAYNSAGTANSLPITISSGTISSNTTWQGIVYTNGNVSVNSGCELQIRPGTTILINPGCSITASSGASIIANGTTSAPIHFEQATPGSQWNEIYLRGDNNYFMNCVFDGGTWDMDVEAGQNNNFSYCTFKNAARGLQLNRGSCIIENCTFSNNQDGIILFYGNTASITQSTISNNSDVGLEMYGTTVSEFAHNDIENNGSHGIDVEGGTLYMGNDGMASYLLGTDPNTTTPSFGAGRNRINNNCRTSSSYEIYVNSGGYLYVGNLLYTSPNYYLQDGFNRITDPHSNYIYNLAMTFGYESQQQWTVPAAKTYWGGSVGGENFYGTVDYSYQLTSDPSGGAGATFTPQSTSPANPAKPAQLMTAAMAGKISKEFPVQSQGQFFVDLKNKMMETMNSIVDPKTGITRPRLIGYLNSLCLFDTNDVTQERKPVWSLLYNYRGNLESDNSSTDHTERLCREASLVAEVQNDIRGGELDSAQDLMYGYSSFVQNNDNKRTLLFAKMEIDERDGNYGQALNVLDQIKEFQPDSHQKRKYVAPNYDVLEALLNQEANGLGKSGNYQQQIEESHVPTQMALLQNYPNPFNPSTVISYQLSEISNVTLKVYDVTGREVAVLQDGTKDAGNYSTTFNASDLASGVYFARLMVEPQKGSRYVKTMKMLLLK
jgi:parallel beta-helix repeat protein